MILIAGQIIDEAMLEDVDRLLNAGEIPDIFNKEEETDIIECMREAVRASGECDTRVSSTLAMAQGLDVRLPSNRVYKMKFTRSARIVCIPEVKVTA